MNRDRKRSQRQEKRLSEEFGGTTNSGSGNGWLRKNDVRSDDLSIEAKTTMAKQYTLRLNELKQAEKYALLDDRIMAFVIEFAAQGDEYVVLNKEDFLNLRHLANEYVDYVQSDYDEWDDPRPAHSLANAEDDF